MWKKGPGVARKHQYGKISQVIANDHLQEKKRQAHHSQYSIAQRTIEATISKFSRNFAESRSSSMSSGSPNNCSFSSVDVPTTIINVSTDTTPLDVNKDVHQVSLASREDLMEVIEEVLEITKDCDGLDLIVPTP